MYISVQKRNKQKYLDSRRRHAKESARLHTRLRHVRTRTYASKHLPTSPRRLGESAVLRN